MSSRRYAAVMEPGFPRAQWYVIDTRLGWFSRKTVAGPTEQPFALAEARRLNGVDVLPVDAEECR